MASKANKGQGDEIESGDAPLLDLNEAPRSVATSPMTN
jgi:hypothetical protein